ncbi:MAG: chemotaxis protein, partial [Ruminiclostridium sp.]|nr:chemotaxis protein [Ruminiclostridium sp.]
MTCGNCLNVCKHDSREYNDDTDDFLSALAGGEKISVIVSADFYSVYGNRAANILGYLRSLGVGKIYDAAFGVDLFVYFTVSELNKYKDDMSERPFILNFCPAVINYIQRYAPYAS